MRYILNVFLCLVVNLLAFSQSDVYRVRFLLDKNSAEISGLLDELANEITAVVGEDAILEFPKAGKLVNNFSSSRALNNYNILLQSEIDIIIAFGIVNNSIISKIGTYPKPTIVFGALSEELVTDKTLVSNITNYTSIVTSQSYTEDIQILQKFANPKRVGIIVEKAFVDNLPIAETFDKIGKDLDLEMRLIPFQSLADISSNNLIKCIFFLGQISNTNIFYFNV